VNEAKNEYSRLYNYGKTRDEITNHLKKASWYGNSSLISAGMVEEWPR